MIFTNNANLNININKPIIVVFSNNNIDYVMFTAKSIYGPDYEYITIDLCMMILRNNPDFCEKLKNPSSFYFSVKKSRSNLWHEYQIEPLNKNNIFVDIFEKYKIK
jgi:hypothetical protein